MNVVYGLPYGLDPGTNFNSHALIFATDIVCHTEIFDQFNWIFHSAGSVVIFTHAKLFVELSFGSVNQKVVVVKVYWFVSFIDIALFVPTGASLIEFTFNVTVALLDAYADPSNPFHQNVAVPL